MSYDEYAPRQLDAGATITTAMWQRILSNGWFDNEELHKADGRPHTREKMPPKVFKLLAREDQQHWAAHHSQRCSNCANRGAMHGDPQRAWCPVARAMITDSFPVLCPHFEKRPQR